MDIDFSSLASRIGADVGGLRGCMIVSRDGLVLGAHHADGENLLRPAWLRFAALGEVEKGFIEFGTEIWVYVHRGPYAAFAVSAPTARPGLLLEELEQILQSAEEARAARRETAAAPPPEPPRTKPRAPLHPEAKPAAQAPAAAPATSKDAERRAAQPPPPEPAQPTEPAAPEKAGEPEPAAEQPAAEPAKGDEGTEVDRVLLAQEFSRLLEESGYDDEDEEEA